MNDVQHLISLKKVPKNEIEIEIRLGKTINNNQFVSGISENQFQIIKDHIFNEKNKQNKHWKLCEKQEFQTIYFKNNIRCRIYKNNKREYCKITKIHNPIDMNMTYPLVIRVSAKEELKTEYNSSFITTIIRKHERYSAIWKDYICFDLSKVIDNNNKEIYEVELELIDVNNRSVEYLSDSLVLKAKELLNLITT